MGPTQIEITFAAPRAADAINPRYAAFCRVHGHTHAEQLAHDAERWPGGKMAGFIVWIRAMWGAWRVEANAKDGGQRSHRDIPWPEDHVALDAWLATRRPCTGCVACEAA